MTTQSKLMEVLQEMGIKFDIESRYVRNGEQHVWWDVGCGDNLSFHFDKDGNFIEYKLFEV